MMQDEMALRSDVMLVLKTLNIDPALLLYQQDLPYLIKLAKADYVKVTLVDHNLLAHDQKDLENYVEMVIDHHQDENVAYPYLIQENKKIIKMGSNATLIADMISSSIRETLSPQIAYLLLSAILLDTKNLKNDIVTTDQDIATANYLKEVAGEYYGSTLYDVLVTARNSIAHLTPDLLLKKDYKVYQEGKLLYGIAALPKETSWTSSNRLQWKHAFASSLIQQNIHLLSALIYDEALFIVFIPEIGLQTAFVNHIQHSPALSAEFILKEHFPNEGLIFIALKRPLQR